MSIEPSSGRARAARGHATPRRLARCHGASCSRALLLGGGFFAAVAALWAIRPPARSRSCPRGRLPAGARARRRVASFDTPFGFTVPTQLAFVPLLFAAPLAIVPIAVVVAFAIARCPMSSAARCRPSRLLSAPATPGSRSARWRCSRSRMSRQPRRPAAAGRARRSVPVDFAASALRYGDQPRGASSPRFCATTLGLRVDAALSGVGAARREDVHRTPLAVLALVPLLGLLALFARERRRRLEGMLELGSAYRGTALVLGDVDRSRRRLHRRALQERRRARARGRRASRS